MESELYSAAEPTTGWMPTPANRTREKERALATDLLLHSAATLSVSDCQPASYSSVGPTMSPGNLSSQLSLK